MNSLNILPEFAPQCTWNNARCGRATFFLASLRFPRDHFNKIVKDWRQLDKRQLRASGTNETFSERERLLTDICASIDAFEEEKTQKKEDKDGKQRQLKLDGETLRDAAMTGLTPSPKRQRKGHVFKFV